jgi:hypothetical protein
VFGDVYTLKFTLRIKLINVDATGNLESPSLEIRFR